MLLFFFPRTAPVPGVRRSVARDSLLDRSVADIDRVNDLSYDFLVVELGVRLRLSGCTVLNELVYDQVL